MRRIITNYRVLFIFNKNFKLYFEFHNPVFNSDMIMPFAAIFRIRNYKILFSNHNNIVIQTKKNVNFLDYLIVLGTVPIRNRSQRTGVKYC